MQLPRFLVPETRNHRTRLLVFSVALMMVGLSYAAVPLYQLFCQVTGYGGTVRTVQLADTTETTEPDPVPLLDRTVEVRFDANVDAAMNWSFDPPAEPVLVQLGETRKITYTARNLGDKTMTGQAMFNVTPQKSGSYFVKIECFCFQAQKLEPGESAEMPVIFYVDPELDEDRNQQEVKTITLSYTFFEMG